MLAPVLVLAAVLHMHLVMIPRDLRYHARNKKMELANDLLERSQAAWDDGNRKYARHIRAKADRLIVEIEEEMRADGVFDRIAKRERKARQKISV